MSKFTIEIGTKMNDDVIWGPTKDRLRGRYQRMNNPTGVTYAPGFTDIPDIPGLHITIDSQKMEAVIYDPLSDPKNVEFLATVSNAHKRTFGEEVGPVATKNFKIRSKDHLATWIFAAMRLIESGFAELKAGTISKDLPGEPEKEHYRAVPKTMLEPHEV